MSFINKVKNFFYEDVEEDDDEFEAREIAKREVKHKKEEEKRRRHQEQEISREIKEQKKLAKPANDDLSELELFRSEKTFNFPDLGDDIFDIGDEPVIEEEKKETRNTVKEEKNMYAKPSRQDPVPSIRTTYQELPIKSEVDDKKFHPSPVVSPVYGILDKNYTVDDVIDKNLSKTKEFSIEKKSVDFDTVRNRAYKELDEEIEATLTKTKDIFYNLEENKEVEEPIEDYIEEEYDKDENNDDVVITYEGEEEKDVEKEELTKLVEEIKVDNEPEEETKEESEDEVDEDLTPDVAIPTVEETPTKEKKIRRSKIVEEEPEDEEKEEKEDLFNLIDNMYNEEEDEEEED